MTRQLGRAAMIAACLGFVMPQANAAEVKALRDGKTFPIVPVTHARPRFAPAAFETGAPSLVVVGTGKNVGKTVAMRAGAVTREASTSTYRSSRFAIATEGKTAAMLTECKMRR